MIERLRPVFAARTAAGRTLADGTNFFEAGLSSIHLAELVVELKAQQIDVTLVDMFRYPTLRQLGAELARRAGAERPAAPLPWDRGR